MYDFVEFPDVSTAHLHFDGASYDPKIDRERLTSQFNRIRTLMLDGEWRTLEQIARTCHMPHTDGISARLRDMRKARFGGYKVERRRRGDEHRGIFEYRVSAA